MAVKRIESSMPLVRAIALLLLLAEEACAFSSGIICPVAGCAPCPDGTFPVEQPEEILPNGCVKQCNFVCQSCPAALILCAGCAENETLTWLPDEYLENGCLKPCNHVCEEAVFCLLDVRECSDGSYVSRVPPTCEFAECPGGATFAPSNCAGERMQESCATCLTNFPLDNCVWTTLDAGGETFGCVSGHTMYWKPETVVREADQCPP